jgi:tetratricopeptide (TPR) repeat protein
MATPPMPRRPRSHQLETESIRAFERLLPSSWIARPISGDYGVDLEVEIFENDSATGNIFKVQLKGTDKNSTKAGNHSVTVATESLSYWRRMDTPVLIVLYSSREGEIYARWAQSYDPHYAKAPDSKTATIKFTSRQRCNPSVFPNMIAQQLSIIRLLRTSGATLPMPLSLEVNSARLNGLHGAVLARLRRAVRDFPDLLKITDDEHSVPRLSVQIDQVKVAAPGNVASSTFHLHSAGQFTRDRIDSLCSDALVVVARFLLTLGATKAAADVYFRHSGRSQISKAPHAIDEFVKDFLAEEMPAEAWMIVRVAYNSPDSEMRRFADIWLTDLFFGAAVNRLSSELGHEIVDVLVARAQGEEESGRRSEAGHHLYTAAKIWQAEGRAEETLDLFLKAADLDPSYLTRGYYLRELAGVQVALRDYEAAIENYRAAVRAGDAPESGYLLSNTLLLAGKYREAFETNYDVDSMHEFYRAQARLHGTVARTVIETSGVDSQQRRQLTADMREQIGPDASKDFLLSVLREADALHSNAWFLLAFLQEDLDRAFHCALTSAFIREKNVEGWILALHLGIASKQTETVVADLCRLAFRFGGDQALSMIDELAENLPDDFADTQRIIHQYPDELPKLPRLVRMLNSDGTYDEYDVDDEDGQLHLGVYRLLATMPRNEFNSLIKRYSKSNPGLAH